MTDQDFSIMDETVTKICNSLETIPERWTFGPFYIISPEGLAIYRGIQNCFRRVRSSKYGTYDELVFSTKHGKEIREAYYKALSITGSRKQQEILKQFNSPTEKPAVTSKPAQLAPRTTSCRLPWILFSISAFFTLLKIKGWL